MYSALSQHLLSDEIHGLPWLALGIVGRAVGMNLLQKEGHVVGQCAHGLHTLGVELHLALC